jgi:hypothetical protein
LRIVTSSITLPAVVSEYVHFTGVLNRLRRLPRTIFLEQHLADLQCASRRMVSISTDKQVKNTAADTPGTVTHGRFPSRADQVFLGFFEEAVTQVTRVTNLPTPTEEGASC